MTCDRRHFLKVVLRESLITSVKRLVGVQNFSINFNNIYIMNILSKCILNSVTATSALFRNIWEHFKVWLRSRSQRILTKPDSNSSHLVFPKFDSKGGYNFSMTLIPSRVNYTIPLTSFQNNHDFKRLHKTMSIVYNRGRQPMALLMI